MRGQKLAIDFDGVIHDYNRGWQGGEIYGNPIEGALKTMDRLTNDGYKLIIFTTRISPEMASGKELKQRIQDIKDWLIENGFFIDVHYHKITGSKPAAIAYIDDRAIRFTNWQDIRKYFT